MNSRRSTTGTANKKRLPRGDLPLPAREQTRLQQHDGKQLTGVAKLSGRLKPLPALRRDMPVAKRLSLFKQKLELCSVVYDANDVGTKRFREVKRQTLMELIKYINTPAGQKQLFTEPMMPFIVHMLAANIFRELQPQVPDFDPEEDEPVGDANWPHLRAVYEYMLRFIVSAEVKAKSSRKYIQKSFCRRIILLFKSEDPRERDYLKTILHRIYGKFTSYRSLIRREIQYTFYQFVFECQPHSGIGELLEILGSIINGFALPLKKEHLVFLSRALIPLHKPRSIQQYHLQLTYCMTQYAEKSPATAIPIISGIVKFWPWTCSSKQVLFFNEVEDVLEVLTESHVALNEELAPIIFPHLQRCMQSSHFQVQERCLYLWSNDNLTKSGCLSKQFSAISLPHLYGPLNKLSKGDGAGWHPTVQGMAQNVMKMYMGFNLKLVNKVTAEHIGKLEGEQERLHKQRSHWKKMEREWEIAAAEREKELAKASSKSSTSKIVSADQEKQDDARHASV